MRSLIKFRLLNRIYFLLMPLCLSGCYLSEYSLQAQRSLDCKRKAFIYGGVIENNLYGKIQSVNGREVDSQYAEINPGINSIVLKYLQPTKDNAKTNEAFVLTCKKFNITSKLGEIYRFDRRAPCALELVGQCNTK